MDRSWIKSKRTTEEYERGVEQFIEFATRNVANNNGRFYCPCVNCLNERRLPTAVIREHVLCDGFLRSYTKWTWHGELVEVPIAHVSQTEAEEVDLVMEDGLEQMIRDVGDDVIARSHMYQTLCSDAKMPLYSGCIKYTKLSAILKLFNVKARNGWSDKSFTELLEKEYEKLHHCPHCGLSRYKQKDGDFEDDVRKGVPAKVLWYLPIIPRFKRLFANVKDAKLIRWHVDERKRDGQIRHPADCSQWQTIDSMFPYFGNDPRNLRLGLATDGMNPYGNLSSRHSSWPVMLVIYNLPPWLCMKRKYVMLSLMVSGPRQPGNDIDVYLSPLVEDLKMLWEEGVDVFDGYAGSTFKLHAMLFCTINDFPAYGNLSGYSTKGHKACPICEEGTCHHQLKHGKKTVYIGHRRFLSANHPFRKLKKAFNGCQENEIAPTPLSGLEVYERVKDINVVLGKTKKQATTTNIWKKRSIFFDLPYWRMLDVRHCIDVMHVEKNVCDSIIGTLLNIQGKTKDGMKSRLDLVEMGIREQLAPQSHGKRTYLPPACHTLSKQEKRSFCEFLHGVKVPYGYSSNVKRLVSMKDLKLLGLKSHDCHVLMQQLLPVAIRGILPKNIRYALTRLCFFFNAICSKVFEPAWLDYLENEAKVILCELEMYFPPSFFDIMVHLIVHLVREIRLCGPVFLRWMYPIERYMKILKGYVKNQYRPEASIVERYIAEEAIEFCTEYILEIEAIGVPKTRHHGRIAGKGTRSAKVVTLARHEVIQAHFYILNNTDIVQPYLSAHKDIVKRDNPRMPEKWLINEHNKTFLRWFKEKVQIDNTSCDTLKWLACEPNFDVICWSGYDINNCSFYTKSEDDKSTMQNSGVMVVAESMHFSSSKDKHPIMASMCYFGVIEDIWMIDYTSFRVPVFKCKWVDSNNGVKTDDLGFTLVDLHKAKYTDEPFIMASQAKQVFYVNDPSNKRWSIVLQGRTTHGSHPNDGSTLDIYETPSFSTNIPTLDVDTEVDDVHATRDDHHEGLWENIPT
ncbi:uncharacterized protein LOC128195186 [Vigna angularis]|uniref:uncharacterized protein LOC128195186 n=1 Tax=Phaseolus angularis TaxID=3914 RepID=UPI0022B4B858|nr:uncharacterized protein LOC128195186 [Vigna angularis]